MIIAGKVRRISLEKLGDWNESEFVVTLQVANTELSFPVTREEVGNYRVDDFLAFDLRAIRLKEINKSKPEDAKFSQSLYDRQSRVQEFERQAGIQTVINNNPEYVDDDYDDNYDDYDDHDEDETTEEPEETTSNQQNTVAIPRNTNQFNEQNSVSQDDNETIEDIMNNDDEMSDEEIAARVGKRDESEIDTEPIVPPRVDTMDPGTITEADYQKASQNQQDNTNETDREEDTQEQNNEEEPDNQLETDDEEGEVIDDLDEDEADDEEMNVAPGGLFNGDQDYGDQSDDEDE
ncbi:hypothetical protein [Ligilactobacillus salivarius]|uniref:Uncharacterized protein n=1 Tax=Ligilactobacillus salivarius TaxID=1624 RepID=A0A2U2M8N9_9LACO|nr:hypothetical protein [Ligilactobacillus salivarius]PWG53229.1 hypothetical protein DB362_04725 [Ligilactobacillus salivarius]